jgi:tRNA G18 (ribose-2'-O)-methylase SpoU
MFCTVLNDLKSPENIGMIVRSHVAFGGDRVVIVGRKTPWRFKKRSQAFSRRLEKVSEIVHLEDEAAFFAWCEAERLAPVAIEIAASPTLLPDFTFPQRTALVVGNEGVGLSPAFLARCAGVVTIPQFGPVGSLNVAISCSIAMYELNRARPLGRPIAGHKYLVQPSERPGAAGPSVAPPTDAGGAT